jgi:hypothetical protein
MNVQDNLINKMVHITVKPVSITVTYSQQASIHVQLYLLTCL